MKNHYDPEYVLRQIDDGIEHSQKEGLPLTAIELTPEEWFSFKQALSNVPGWQGGVALMSKKAEVIYQGIRIFEGPAP